MSSGAVIEIVGGGVDELPAVDQLMRAAFDPRFGEAWSKAQCLATFAMPGYALRVARRGGAIVAFAIFRWVADDSELLLLAVDPQVRSQGIGAAMINDWLDFAHRKGARRYFLEMRTDNPAKSLYSRCGFTVISTRPGYYRGNDGHFRDAVTMHHVLCDN